MKKILLLFVVFISINGYSQKDSIVTYLNGKGKVITDKNKAIYFEILTKKSDTLWLSRKFRRSGKIYTYSHYKSKDKKVKIGESVSFDKHGNMKGVTIYNAQGKKHGRTKLWFDNGNINLKGIYLNGKKEGLWKCYFYDGSLAGKVIFKNDSIIKETFYDTSGNELDKSVAIIKEQKPKFKGGIKKYEKHLKTLTDNISYQVKGRVFVEYVIDINGNVKDVTLSSEVPEKFKQEIISFFENIKGWEPAIHLNRNIPYSFTQTLKFNK